MSPDDPRHGEPRGYRAHRRAGQEACAACKRAAADDSVRRKNEQYLGKPPRTVPARGVLRRLRALYALGWTGEHIAKAGGWPSKAPVTNLARATRGRDHVYRITADRMDRAYKTLSMTPGPSNLTREKALREGWAAPFAWDDIDTDARPQGQRVEQRGCGTKYGYHEHWRAGEQACVPCKRAYAKHVREKAWARGVKPRKPAPRRSRRVAA